MNDCMKKNVGSTQESQTGGVRVISIQGRLARERERLTCMTDDERHWRAQWVSDQRLCDHEPVKVPEIRDELQHPIRRFYRYPLDRYAEYLTPKLGKVGALAVRKIIGVSMMMIFGVYCTAYYFKYNANDWTRKGGWRVISSRRSFSPGQRGYPYAPDRFEGADYSDRGFKHSPIQKPLNEAIQPFLNIVQHETPSPDLEEHAVET